MSAEWSGLSVACVTLATVALLCHTNVAEEQVTYDQRQRGDLNVHVHVKDVGILALLDESLQGGYGVRMQRRKQMLTLYTHLTLAHINKL